MVSSSFKQSFSGSQKLGTSKNWFLKVGQSVLVNFETLQRKQAKGVLYNNNQCAKLVFFYYLVKF
jgi:hypothetical protein